MRRKHARTLTEDRDGGVAAALIAIPVILTIGIFAVIAHSAAVRGASYRKVKLLLLPLIFVLANFFGGMAFLCLGWFGALLTGSTDAANYIVGHTADLTMLTTLFGEKDIPTVHVIVFQILLWIIVGRPFARFFTFSIYDYAIQKIAIEEGEHPRDIRQDIYDTDEGYAEAMDFYLKKEKLPWLALLLVGTRTPIRDYY